GFGALPFFVGTFLVTHNGTLAMNLTFLTGVTLTAWSLHAVATRWTGSHLAAFVAAWTFLTTPWVLWHWGPVAPNYVVLPYFPWIIFLAEARPLTRRRAMGLAALTVLQALVSVYVAVAVLGPLAMLATLRIARPSTRADGLRLGA